MRVFALPFVMMALSLSGCAGLLDRPEAPIRRGESLSGTEDASLSDATLGLDAGELVEPGTGLMPDRTVWLLLRSDSWADGLRAHLDPPHPPQSMTSPMQHAAQWPLLVHWSGPDSPGTRNLLALHAEGVPIGVWYDLRRRAEQSRRPQTDVVADISWLVARVLGNSGLLEEDGRPVLVVTTDADNGSLAAAARARLDDLGVTVYWIEQIDPFDPVAVPPADGIMPRCTHTRSERLDAWRVAAEQAGVRWIPCASPPINPRLEQPTWSAESSGTSAFVAHLIRRRRIADAGDGLMVVDGLGGWRDDRQIDAVVGELTTQPEVLTDGVTYHPYEMERLRAVHALTRETGPRPSTLATAPLMVEIHRDDGVLVNRLRRIEQGVGVELTDSTGSGHYELLLDQHPFVLGPRCSLRYGRTHAGLFIDLVTADGRRLGAPPPGDEVFITVDLASWSGRRIEEVLLVYGGGSRQIRGEIAGARIACEGELE